MFTPTDEQRELRAGIVPFCEAINEGHIERDARGEFSHDAWKLLRGSGILLTADMFDGVTEVR